MNNGQRQTMKLQQKLTPKQILLMQLLQLPITSLELRIKEEVEKNPLLEITSESSSMMESLPNNSTHDNDIDEESDTDDDDYSYRERVERDKNQDGRSADFISESSFNDFLLEQLAIHNLSELQQTIATEIIGSLDDTGYLSRSIELISNDLAFTQGIEVTPKEVENVLLKVQQLDPPGIAARNLQECLSIQLHRCERQTPDTKLAITVVDHFFEPFVNHRYQSILQALDIDQEQLQGAIERIHKLNPKPGASDYDSSHSHYIIPDIIVTNHNGRLDLFINDQHLPQLQINDYYHQMLSNLSDSSQPTTPGEKETLDFLLTNNEYATTLIDTLQQRHATILKVMKVILQKQHKFFLTGESADLRPLMQKDVAEAVGLDATTISRIVNSKYVQTDFDTFLLKECFSQSIINEKGEEIATEQIYNALTNAIEQEDKSDPLSDEALSELLKEQGYPIARRTVSKYREILNIPPRRLRRQLKSFILLILLSLSTLCTAQQPQKESYFDSILNARIREGQAQSRNSGSQTKNPQNKKNTKNNNAKERPQQGGLEIHEPEPEPTALDTALANGDEYINLMYNATMPAPSQLWYGRNLSGSLVRLVTLSMDSLPDEINIQLLKGNEKFCFPIKNVKTSPYGWRWNRPHRGVDIRLNMGDPVHCAFNGVVRIARPMGAYGNLVVVRHYNGLETVYGHLSKINVKPMQIVVAGQTLGLGGSTGRSTGPHLHFEVRFQYEPFDPEWILDFSNYTLRTRHLYLDKTYFGIRKPKAQEAMLYKADKSIIPEEQPKAKQPSKPVYATLKKDETLEAFAKRNYTTVEKIKALNPELSKPKSGTKLRVR